MYAVSYGKKEYELLGKMLVSKKPEIAKELATLYLPDVQPLETDHTKIKDFFTIFCESINVHPKDYIGPLYKTSKVEIRRQFLAAILHIYTPNIYFHPVERIILDKNLELSKRLCEIFKIKKSNLSVMIRQVVIWEKQYEMFKDQVDQTVKILTNGRAPK